MKEILVREAMEKDITLMAEMDKLCFSAPWSEKSFREEIMQNDLALYIVAELGEKAVGYAGMWLIIDEAHITNVAVHPDYRRRGIGNALITVLTDICKKSGINSQTLEVRPSNEAALALYGKFGFEKKGIRKGYYDDNGEDALIMWRGERMAE